LANQPEQEEQEDDEVVQRQLSNTSSSKIYKNQLFLIRNLIIVVKLLTQMSSIDLQEPTLNKVEENPKRSCCRTPFFFKLLKINSPEKFYLLIGSICSLLFGGVEPAVGLIYSMVYGLLAIPNLDDQSTRTRYLALTIFGIYVVAGILQFLSTVTFAKSGEELTLRMRLFTFQAMLKQEMSWFDDEQNNVGSLITRLSSDTAALKVK
jgi:ATP-binding cassette subfamily B (MDR/TAP) protein 1